MPDIQTIFYGLLGGVVPTFIWLIFWLHEDSKRPEPRLSILKAFVAGMVAVIIVLPFQKIVDDVFPGMTFTTFLLWSTLEELFKFGMAYIVVLRSRDDDEPIDGMIYMITIALGFVALENTLFILNPLLQQDIVGGILTGNLRFIGASLLHIVSSAAIGIALAMSFYKGKIVRAGYLAIGISFAIFFHTAFNLFIINQSGLGTFLTFGVVWAGITALLLFFEMVKTIKPEPIYVDDESISTTLASRENSSVVE